MGKAGNVCAKFDHLKVKYVILESICLSSFLELAPVLEIILKTCPSCDVLLLAPYYLRQDVLSRFSSFYMLAYKVAYSHPSLGTPSVYPSRAETPVRIFTNIPLPRVPSPQEAGYFLCLECNDWVSYTTKHCSQCNRCISADGEWCPHLRGPERVLFSPAPALAPLAPALAPAPVLALAPAPVLAPALASAVASALAPALAPITLETPSFRSSEEKIKAIVSSEGELDAGAELMRGVRETDELGCKYVVLLQ
jgi:hypothetical protein